MGFLKGSASFVRFQVVGELPENEMDFIADRIMAFAFQDIDDTYDEYSIGWVSVLNMFDAQFRYASYVAGDCITMALRVDERKVSAAILKKMTQKEEERVRREKGLARLSRSAKTQIKERVRSELTKKALPVPALYEICWNLSTSTLLFFSTNKKAQVLLEDFFQESFGLLLRQQIPYTLGESMLDDDKKALLEGIRQDVFSV